MKPRRSYPQELRRLARSTGGLSKLLKTRRPYLAAGRPKHLVALDDALTPAPVEFGGEGQAGKPQQTGMRY